MANEVKVNGGVGFCGLLTIVLIVLKLTKFITWSWWWVTCPLWMPWTIALVVFIICRILIFFDKR